MLITDNKLLENFGLDQEHVKHHCFGTCGVLDIV